MPLYDRASDGRRTFLLMDNPKTVKDDWESACCLWWGKYGENNQNVRNDFMFLLQDERIPKFYLQWQALPKRSFITWSFPENDPTKLTIKGFVIDGEDARAYLLADVADAFIGINEGGLIHLKSDARDGDLPAPGDEEELITPAHVPAVGGNPADD